MDSSFGHKTLETLYATVEYDSVCAFIVRVCFHSGARAPEFGSLSIGEYDHRLLLFYCQLYQFNRLLKCFTVLSLLKYNETKWRTSGIVDKICIGNL